MTRVFDEANKFLGYVIDAASEQGVILPEKHVIVMGLAAYDCEMVAVQTNEVNTGLPGEPQPVQANCDPPWSNVCFVDIVRCGPKISQKGIVSADAQAEHSKVQSMDTDVLMAAVRMRLFDPLSFGPVSSTIVYPTREGDFMATRLVLSTTVG